MNANQEEIPFGSNLVICCSTGNGGDGKFSCLITDAIPDLNIVRSGQAFPMFIYEYEIPEKHKEK
ncbi:type ISP restriction/modification enzyme [Neisseria cinerea]|uniref:type ISP restriction/modification enzyme n=1 Tax=Neisseria cinerea TaxID=483 RepID=UPI000C33AB25|nr:MULTISPECIES: type ISP restriction/modification enzyme [Neisseria]DAK39995.1 MAG TPA: putative helicase [Bacteriophage sp.]